MRWEYRRADQLTRHDIVLMPEGQLRVVSQILPPRNGNVHVRLGATWYVFACAAEFPVDVRPGRGSGGLA
ncbi:hypothetical protein KIK06_25400 [Nocardiopsis sp. EMB25]|uniref:hypothetical protein n=1 Tax=Nocardiopsis sp. EMB25 TaxID=2835867 RepID=UPI002283FB8C|nr:hypothetical protein [Nocardiopsis sp. EMB25]MCY9787222.1 hypothetical protein [Nocardiopsis sp. EMB25]